MSSTQDINSFNDEVTQINTLKKDFDDIRRQLEELRLKIGERKGNKGVAVQETTTLPASDDDYMVERDDSVQNSMSESGAGSGYNAKMNINIVPTLPIKNQFDPRVKYTPTQIQEYHDVASNLIRRDTMSIQDKYNIIINAENRINYLKKNKNTNSDEYKELNNIFEKCNNPLDKTSDNHCQKIKSMWNDIQERHTPRNYNISQQSTARSTPPTSPRSTPGLSSRLSPEEFKEKAEKDILKARYTFLLTHKDQRDLNIDEFNKLDKIYGSFVQTQIQNIDGLKNNKDVLHPIKKKSGGKRNSTMKRGKQHKKSQKKSKSHKKSRTHKKRH